MNVVKVKWCASSVPGLRFATHRGRQSDGETTKPWQRLTPLMTPFISTLLYRYHVTVNMTTVIILLIFVGVDTAVISPIFIAARPIGA
jgi:hypothetical protein